MSGAIAILVKTPGYSPVKTRLARAVGDAVAIEWHRRAAAAVAGVATAAAGLAVADAAADPAGARAGTMKAATDQRRTAGASGRSACATTATGDEPARATSAPGGVATVYWAVAEVDAVAAGGWPGLPVLAQGEGGLGARMGRIHHALVRRHGAGILLGADAPQLAAGRLAEALDWCRGAGPRQVLGAARDGGFWLYGGNRTAPLAVWESVPYGAADTADRFRAAFAPFGAWLESVPLTDVDYGEDLPAMRRELAALPAPLSAQRALAEWLDATFGSAGIDDDRRPAGDRSGSAPAGERRAGR